MSSGLRTVIYPDKDLPQAKTLYGELLGVEPYPDETYSSGSGSEIRNGGECRACFSPPARRRSGRSAMSVGGDLARLTASQFRLLDQLAPDGDRVTDVALRDRITKQALGQLADLGYVDIVEDPTDRRARVIRRTAHGEHARRAVRSATTMVEDQWRSEVGEALQHLSRGARRARNSRSTNLAGTVTLAQLLSRLIGPDAAHARSAGLSHRVAHDDQRTVSAT